MVAYASGKHSRGNLLQFRKHWCHAISHQRHEFEEQEEPSSETSEQCAASMHSWQWIQKKQQHWSSPSLSFSALTQHSCYSLWIPSYLQECHGNCSIQWKFKCVDELSSALIKTRENFLVTSNTNVFQRTILLSGHTKYMKSYLRYEIQGKARRSRRVGFFMPHFPLP